MPRRAPNTMDALTAEKKQYGQSVLKQIFEVSCHGCCHSLVRRSSLKTETLPLFRPTFNQLKPSETRIFKLFYSRESLSDSLSPSLDKNMLIAELHSIVNGKAGKEGLYLHVSANSSAGS